MKTIVIFYSYTGNTKKLAQEIAAKESADITEIRDVRRPGNFKAYTMGCFAAMRSKTWLMEPIAVNLQEYDRLIIMAPVWAGHLPPVINALLEQLPAGKIVSCVAVSGSGHSSCKAQMEAFAKIKNCTLDKFEDIKA